MGEIKCRRIPSSWFGGGETETYHRRGKGRVRERVPSRRRVTAFPPPLKASAVSLVATAAAAVVADLSCQSILSLFLLPHPHPVPAASHKRHEEKAEQTHEISHIKSFPHKYFHFQLVALLCGRPTYTCVLCFFSRFTAVSFGQRTRDKWRCQHPTEREEEERRRQ